MWNSLLQDSNAFVQSKLCACNIFQLSFEVYDKRQGHRLLAYAESTQHNFTTDNSKSKPCSGRMTQRYGTRYYSTGVPHIYFKHS